MSHIDKCRIACYPRCLTEHGNCKLLKLWSNKENGARRLSFDDSWHGRDL